MRLPRLTKPKAAPEPGPNPDPIVVVVGLRNPGRDYEETRHNIGHRVVSRVAQRATVELGRAPSKVRAQVAKIGSPPAMLVAPLSYMNDSGGVVRSVLEYWKLSAENLLVIHDDIDLAFGRLRVQVGGGSGGHNGIRSLERALGGREFSRLKVGVGRPPGSQDPSDFVLRAFSKSEQADLGSIIEDAADVVEEWLVDRAKAQEMAAHRGRDG